MYIKKNQKKYKRMFLLLLFITQENNDLTIKKEERWDNRRNIVKKIINITFPRYYRLHYQIYNKKRLF